MELLTIKRALLSATNKAGLENLASFLAGAGVELVSTGGTHAALRAAGLELTRVSDVTGFPEILDCRVKTLHPAIHGGILADKDNPEHERALAGLGIRPFDLICVNLYDFSGALAKNMGEKATIEEIDIGGPCLLRAAAKNYHSVLTLPHPRFYEEAQQILSANAMRVPLAFRRATAAAAFAAVSDYDAMIASWLRGDRPKALRL